MNGTELERSIWVTLNRIKTHQGKCGSCLLNWGIIESPCCDCGALDQTIAHITLFWPLEYIHGSCEELNGAKSNRALDWLKSLNWPEHYLMN